MVSITKYNNFFNVEEKFETNITLRNILDDIFYKDNLYTWTSSQLLYNLLDDNDLNIKLLDQYINDFILRYREKKITTFFKNVIKVGNNLQKTFGNYLSIDVAEYFHDNLFDKLKNDYKDMIDVYTLSLLNDNVLENFLKITEPLKNKLCFIFNEYYSVISLIMSRYDTYDEKYIYIDEKLSNISEYMNTTYMYIQSLEHIINEVISLNINPFSNITIINICKHYANIYLKNPCIYNINLDDINNYFAKYTKDIVDSIEISNDTFNNMILFKKLVVLLNNIFVLIDSKIITDKSIIDTILTKDKNINNYINQAISTSLVKIYSLIRIDESVTQLINKLSNILNLYGFSENIDDLLGSYLNNLKDRLSLNININIDIENQLYDAINKNIIQKPYSLVYCKECINDYIYNTKLNNQIKKLKINTSTNINQDILNAIVLRADIWNIKDSPKIKLIDELIPYQKIVTTLYGITHQDRIKLEIEPIKCIIEMTINNNKVHSNLYIATIIYHIYNNDSLKFDDLIDKLLIDMIETNIKYIRDIIDKLVDKNIITIKDDIYQLNLLDEDVLIK